MIIFGFDYLVDNVVIELEGNMDWFISFGVFVVVVEEGSLVVVVCCFGLLVVMVGKYVSVIEVELNVWLFYCIIWCLSFIDIG